eukprot:529505_1
MLRRALSRPLIHIQKSLCLQSSMYLPHRRQFADDSSDKPTTTKVIEMEEEKEESGIKHVEDFEMPPIRPTYQTKTPMELIAEVPIIEIDASFVKCDGLHFESDMSPRREDIKRHPYEGHLTQWITLNTRKQIGRAH